MLLSRKRKHELITYQEGSTKEEEKISVARKVQLQASSIIFQRREEGCFVVRELGYDSIDQGLVLGSDKVLV